jgi:hypothetical protein
MFASELNVQRFIASQLAARSTGTEKALLGAYCTSSVAVLLISGTTQTKPLVQQAMQTAYK